MRKTKDQIVEFDADRVRPLPDQPRKRFRGINELAESIREVGQMSPGIVTMIEGTGSKFDAQLIDGERRLRACQLAGVPFLAIVRPGQTDDEAFVSSFAANFGKQDHDCIEIAEGLERMRRGGKSVEQLARITGHSDCWVYQYLNLLKLSAEVRELMVSEDEDSPRLTFQLAMLLVPLPHEKQLKLAKKVIGGEGMKLTAARRMVLDYRVKSGDENVHAGGHGRRRTVEALESLLEMVTDKIGIYLDMPGTDFNGMIDGESNIDKRRLIKGIEEVSDSLIDLAEAIEARLPKLVKRSA